MCGVLGHLAPVQQCARSVRCFDCAVSWATWLLFTGVPARCVVLCVRCPWRLGSCSPVLPLGGLLCVCGVLGHSAPDHRCARSVRCFAAAVSWATWPLFTGMPARCIVLCQRPAGPLGSCSPGFLLGALFCLCGVLGHLAPVHRCACSVCCVACAVFWATWLLFNGVPALSVALRVRCPGPLGPAKHRRPRPVRCFACAVSWATWLLFTGVPARCVLLRVRWPGPPGSCSPVCPLGALLCVCSVLDHLAPVRRCVLCCVCGVLGHVAPVHRCACLVCCVVCAVSWATWVLFTGVLAPCDVSCPRCPGALGSCSPVCPLCPVLCLCGFLGHLAPVHRCARSVCCVACAVSWATWLLFTGVPAWCVVLGVRCPGPLGSCSHGVAAWCVALHVRCPGPRGSCSPVCPLGVLCCVCGVLGHLAPVQQCARPVRCFVCAVSWATWLLFTGVPARSVVLCVRCPGPLGS